MANQIVDITTNINLLVDGGNDGVVFTDSNLSTNTFNGNLPSLALVGGILEAFVGGSQEVVTSNGDVVDEEPFVGGRSHHLPHGIIVFGINGINAGADETVVITLLVETIVGSGRATITRTNINDTVGILGHATDQQVLIANLMPGHTVVVGFVDTSTH